MEPQIEISLTILTRFLIDRQNGLKPLVDRKEVVAHATLSALAHHWPSRATSQSLFILEATKEIKTAESSRWMTQRRIAIAKLQKSFESSSFSSR